MNIHFIAIGGAVMHNLAMALHIKGYKVSGSDDEIFEPSKSRLDAHGLLPEKQGWDPTQITTDLDAVILGMHARPDNPELKKAQEIGLKIYSFPEYLYEQSKNKLRVAIGGSHGKTTITSMVMHVMKYYKKKFDYMVGSQIEGFDTMVQITDDAEIIILEGDEYLSSPIDLRPKFHLYKPHIALLTGIAWDHMNVFPTFESYLDAFRIFTEVIEPAGKLYYFAGDQFLPEIIEGTPSSVETKAYDTHPHSVSDEGYHLTVGEGSIRVPMLGRHNMQNIQGAKLICGDIGISDIQFYKAIQSFKGAARRQQLLAESENLKVYLDFAHAPSKVKATVEAFREAWPDRKLITFLELHTFSSLNKDFLPQYKGSLDKADQAILFFNPDVVRHKNLPPLSPDEVGACFEKEGLEVLNSSEMVEEKLLDVGGESSVLLIMSSGNFSGLDLHSIANSLI